MNVYSVSTPGELLSGNSYPGRGIVLGCTPGGKHAVSAYFIMGRSDNSRNRVFTLRNGELFTEPFDASKVEDPSLIIYAALRTFENKLIVTNGDQTDTVYQALEQGKDFAAGLRQRCFEPDSPNFTPRISGMVTFEDGGFSYALSILKSADPEGGACSRYFYEYPAVPGVGQFIHTYIGDGSPLPTFCGEPERMTMDDSIDAFTADLWNNLDENNRISLYVRYTNPADGSYAERLINKHAEV